MSSWFGFGKSTDAEPPSADAEPPSAGDEGSSDGWWASVQASPGYLADTFTDACAAIEKSFRADDNAAEFFIGPGDALADTWGDFKQSLVPIYDTADVSWMSLKVFWSKEFGGKRDGGCRYLRASSAGVLVAPYWLLTHVGASPRARHGNSQGAVRGEERWSKQGEVCVRMI